MTSTEVGWTRLETEESFQLQIADRMWTSDGMTFTIHSDGRLTGQVDEEALIGKWYWSDRYFCRTAELSGEDLGLDCEIIEIRENQMRYTRDKGKGETSIVTIKKKP